MASEAAGVFCSLEHRKKRLQLGEVPSLLPMLPIASSGRQLREKWLCFPCLSTSQPFGSEIRGVAGLRCHTAVGTHKHIQWLALSNQWLCCAGHCNTQSLWNTWNSLPRTEQKEVFRALLMEDTASMYKVTAAVLWGSTESPPHVPEHWGVSGWLNRLMIVQQQHAVQQSKSGMNWSQWMDESKN